MRAVAGEVPSGTRVFLDDVEVKDCRWADEETGEVCLTVRDVSGKIVLTDDGKEIKTAILKGVVRVETPDWWRRS